MPLSCSNWLLMPLSCKLIVMRLLKYINKVKFYMDLSKTRSLRQKIVSAGIWIIGGHFANQIIRLASNLIMTRLLVPEMFGVMALANVLFIGLHMISDVGLSQNVIQSKRGSDPEFLNTVWTVQIARGAVITLFGWGLAVLLYLVNQTGFLAEGSAYTDPMLPLIVATISINAMISGFESTNLATADRNLTLSRVVSVDLISQVSSLVIMITWAYFFRSIWALVFGSLIYSFLRSVLSHKLLPGIKNHFHWDPSSFTEIFHFGKWVFLTSILGFFSLNGDRILLGGMTNASTLGLYAIAYFMISAILDIFSKIYASVAFPALSEVVRERPQALKDTYYKFRIPVDALSLFSAGFLFVAGHLLIQIFYDDRYLPAGRMLEILSISLLEIRYGLASQCYIALGKPKLLAPIISVRLLALYVFMPVAYILYGFEGALWMAGGSALFTIPLTIIYKIRHGLFDLKKELAGIPWIFAGVTAGILANFLFAKVMN